MHDAGELADSPEVLLAAAQAGDRAACNKLLAAQRPRAIALALRVLHNQDDAEDTVQEAFVKIWRRLPDFEGRSSFATWVHRIVINASLDLMRRRANYTEVVATEQHMHHANASAEPASARTPEAELAEREVASLVRLAVAELPPDHRQVVELGELEDCPRREIALRLRYPVGTVLSRLYYARVRLAAALRPVLLEDLAA